jgi:Homeodomain-like domain
MRRFSFRGRGSRGLFRRYYRLLTNWVTILPSMPWVFGGMDARMNKARVRAGLEARRLEAARLPQIGVEPPEVARRLKVSRTSVWRWKQAFAANRRSDRGKRSWRGGALRKAPRYLAPAAADRRREEAIGRSARSRRLGARICHRSVDAGARGQAHREDQLQAVFGIGCVAAQQEIELILPAAERSREASAAAILHWKKKRRPTLKKARENAEPSSSSTGPG